MRGRVCVVCCVFWGAPGRMASTPRRHHLTRPTQNTPHKPAEAVHVHVDHLHMGVGGDNTWEPDLVHPEYLIPAVGSWRFEVRERLVWWVWFGMVGCVLGCGWVVCVGSDLH